MDCKIPARHPACNMASAYCAPQIMFTSLLLRVSVGIDIKDLDVPNPHIKYSSLHRQRLKPNLREQWPKIMTACIETAMSLIQNLFDPPNT